MKHLPLLVLIGAALGFVIGSYSPAITTWLIPVGDVYVRLMEVIVLPYLVSSLILGLGSLSRETAGMLLKKSWGAYLGLWATCFAILFVAAMTVPRIGEPVVFDFAEAVPERPANSQSLVDLLVPNNFFDALSQNYIPSVVLMGIIFGIAVQSIEKRDGFLNFLTVVSKACVRIWGWIIYIAPLGVCALLAGSLSSTDSAGFAAMSIYIAVICTIGLFMAIWLLPMMLTCFIPVRYWDLFRELKDAYLIAFVTSLSVAALPRIQSGAQNIAGKAIGENDANTQREIIQTSLAVSYPLAQVGNFFILVFMLYASFYYFIPIAIPQLIELPFVTLLTGVGSPSSSIGAVSFLATWLNLPSETTDLYLATMTITRYVQVIASVAGFSFVTFLVVFTFYGRLTFRPVRAALTLIVTIAVLSGISTLGRLGGSHIPLHSESSYSTMTLPADLQTFSDANLVAVAKNGTRVGANGTPADNLTAQERIQTSGILRVGFNPHVSPFVYENNASQYVGFDVEMMFRFARDMNVQLELFPYDWRTMEQDLIDEKFDIAIGGLYITAERLNKLSVSDAYYSNPVALIVRSDRVQEFSSHAKIRQIENLTIAVFDDPVLIPLSRRLFPSANIKVVADYDNLEQEQGVDAAIWTLEQARAWAISHSGYSSVVPSGMASQYLFGYLMPPGWLELADYVNFWLDQQRQQGVLEDMTKRWIDPAVVSSPR